MSRYVIWTDDENLEVTTGFDEGLGGYFLTIADALTCTGESGGYLFHNMDHHPSMGMGLADIIATLGRFGMKLPPDLQAQLVGDARDASEKVRLIDPQSRAYSPAGTINKRQIVRWNSF